MDGIFLASTVSFLSKTTWHPQIPLNLRLEVDITLALHESWIPWKISFMIY